MGYRRYLLIILMLIGVQAMAMPMDSLRLESRNGKSFVIHQVDEGETLYAISRRYGAGVNAILEANDLSNGQISIGQLISIPWQKPVQSNPEGKFITHTVQSGETLFGISRAYEVSVDVIRKANGFSDNTLAVGQVINIPRPVTQKNEVDEAKEEVTEMSGQFHEVKPSETLYSISRLYNVSVSELKALNKLQSNALDIGQKLLIKAQTITQTDPSPGKTDVVEITTEEEDNNDSDIEDANEAKEEVVVVEDKSVQDNDAENNPSLAESKSDSTKAQPRKYGNTDQQRTNTSGIEQILEEGFAMKIENSPKTRKYLALHRTVPIGTIMQVRNQMNNQHIFVRVVGKLPDTGINNNILIRLTDIAFERLGALDPKIPVEVTYLPE